MIINCVSYQNGHKLADISVDEIRCYAGRPDSYVWVALKNPDPAEFQAMRDEFDLHDLAVEATGKLFGGRVPQICVNLQDYYRDVYDRPLRLNQAVDSLGDMVTTALSVTISLISMQENKVAKKLAACAALVAVPTLIAGVYGMNFKTCRN